MIRLRCVVLALASALVVLARPEVTLATPLYAYGDFNTDSIGVGVGAGFGLGVYRLNVLVDASGTITQLRSPRFQNALDVEGYAGLGVFPSNLGWWFQINLGVGAFNDFDAGRTRVTPRLFAFVGQTRSIGFAGSIFCKVDTGSGDTFVQLRPGVAATTGHLMFIGSLFMSYATSDRKIGTGAGLVVITSF